MAEGVTLMVYESLRAVRVLETAIRARGEAGCAYTAASTANTHSVTACIAG